jgi:Phage tail tube protein, GTA-gp10
MSSEDGSITLPFGDGDYTFRIAFAQWRELQESINRPRIEMGHPVIGPAPLVQALLTLSAWPNDVREVIRLGLIGGGMKSDRALVLVKRYVEGKPFFANTLLAGKVVRASMFGPEEDPVGKEPAPPEPEAATETTSSGSLNSTGSVLQ